MGTFARRKTVALLLELIFVTNQWSAAQTPDDDYNSTATSAPSPTANLINGTSITPALLTNRSSTVAPVSTVSCTYQVANDTIDDFIYILKTRGYKLVYMKLFFPEGTQVSAMSKTFRPYDWIWTFCTPEGADPFLSWTRDYRVLSFGVLDSFTYDQLPVKLKVHPPDCPVVLGSASSTQGISRAIGEIMMTYLSTVKQDYNHSIWCYQEIRTVLELPDLVANSLGIITRTLVHRCCRLKFDKDTRTRHVFCSVHDRSPDHTTTTLPYTLGVVGLFFFPIWLFSFAYSMSPKSVPNSHSDQRRLSTLDLNIADDVTWLYQGTRSPVTLSSIFKRTIPYFKQNPRLASRLQRVSLIFFLPILIYIRLALYYFLQADYLQDCVDENVPIGYLSLLFGFDKSWQNVFTALGGPYVLHGVYFLVGAVMVCIPRDLSRAMCSVLHETPKRTKTPLRLDLNVASKIGGISCSREDNSYKLVCRVLQANLFMLINIDFWTLMSKLQFARFVEITERFSHFHRLGKLVILTPITALYIICCFAEIILCVFYYGIPLIYFIVLILRVYIKLTMEAINNNGYLNNANNPLAVCIRQLKYPLSVLIVVATSYIVYAFCAIVVSSFAFLFGVMTFTYIGVVAYPSTAFGYYIFAITSFYYVWKAVRDIDTGYMDLFKKTISVSKTVEKEIPIASNIQPPEPNTGAETILLSVPIADVRISCVRMCGGRPGIPKDLFETVIDLHRPFRVCVLISLLRLSCVFLLVVTTVRLVSSFSKYRDISVIVSFLSSLIVVSLPRVFSLAFSHTDRAAIEEDFMIRLSNTVRNYWNHKDRRDLVSVCLPSQTKV